MGRSYTSAVYSSDATSIDQSCFDPPPLCGACFDPMCLYLCPVVADFGDLGVCSDNVGFVVLQCLVWGSLVHRSSVLTE